MFKKDVELPWNKVMKPVKNNLLVFIQSHITNALRLMLNVF